MIFPVNHKKKGKYNMDVMKVFIKKELNEILYSKRLIISLLAGTFCCVFMNIVANMPGSEPIFNFDIVRGLLCVNYLVIFVCSDIVYITMVEEISYGTFDILCISKIKKRKILLLKCALPIVISLILFAVSIIINNIVSSFSSKLFFLHTDAWYWIFAVMASMGCNFAEFGKCMNTKHQLPSGNNLWTFVCGSIYAISYYYMVKFGPIMFAMAICLTCIMYFFALHKINKITVLSETNYIEKKLNILDGNYIKSIFSRELKRTLSLKSEIFRIVYYTITLIIIQVVLPENVYKNIFIYILLYMLALVISVNIFLESVRMEIYEKMDELLTLAKIDKKSNYKLIMLFSISLGMLICIIYSVLLWILYMIKIVKSIRWNYYITYLFILIFSGICSYMLACKHFNNLKAFKQIKKSVYLITAIVLIIVLAFKI